MCKFLFPRNVMAAAMLAFGFAMASVAPTAAARTAPARSGNLSAVQVNRMAPLVYVASTGNNTIYIFDRNGKAAGTITSGISSPAGIFVDAEHNLWVANPGAHDVLMFARGATMPSMTIADTNQPNDVGQCPNGSILVADSLNDGGIAVYPPGRTQPSRRLVAEVSGMGSLENFVTCDRKGNVFATGLVGASPFPAITGWKHAKQSGYTMFPLDDFYSEGIVATKGGTLLVAGFTGKSNSQPAIIEYTEEGQATGQSVTTGNNLWAGLALDSKREVVYGAVPNANMGSSVAFPSGTQGVSYSASGITTPQGIAFDPGG